MSKVSTALISVTDKGGIVDFAMSLEKLGVEILSTGGTARTLRDGGVKVLDILRKGDIQHDSRLVIVPTTDR